jgi:hypothetical protein
VLATERSERREALGDVGPRRAEVDRRRRARPSASAGAKDSIGSSVLRLNTSRLPGVTPCSAIAPERSATIAGVASMTSCIAGVCTQRLNDA